MEQHPITRRIGKFRLSDDFVKRFPEDVMKIMAEVVVVRCEFVWADMTFYYIAFSRHFEDSYEFEPFEYQATMEQINTGTEEEPVLESRFVEFRKIEKP